MRDQLLKKLQDAEKEDKKLLENKNKREIQTIKNQEALK